MRTQRSFQLTAIDRHHVRHAREESGNNARHAAMKLVHRHPEFWRVLSNKGNPVYTIQNIDDIPPPPDRGAMREALERAKQQAEAEKSAPPPEPEASDEAEAADEAPATGYSRPNSIMAQIREVIVPLLPQLPHEFTRKDVENLLCAHGAAHLINRASVNNVLNTWANQKPEPTTVKRVYRASGELKEGFYTVLESAKNQGRKAAKMAAKAAGTYFKEEEAPEPAAPASSPVPAFTDPAAVPLGVRNASYMQSHPALRNNTNGHAPPIPSSAGVAIEAAPAPTPALAPASAAVAVPAAPAVANIAGAQRVAATLSSKAKEDLFTLLGAGMIDSAQDDKSEIEAAMDMVMQGYDRLTKVMQRQAAMASMRERVGLLLQETAA